ncbi:DcrB-related protein [Trinickia fusca]|uniref:DUF1795 domain-containing protein n=1 Tax=Trinickia fusca TaxID=2419777 RepID=A0A494XE27_9BURK|nr:DcrB-related protein [Trinickia fusca]RKP46384.1 DUF1795 domain-containing protein [Trinickia fusca]
MDYAINEGTFTIPDSAIDRTVNMVLLNFGPGGLSLVVSRDTLLDEESEEAFITRQVTAASRQVGEFTEHARRAVSVGAAQRPGTQLEYTFESNGATFHQLQTVFRVDDVRMLVLTVTCASPLEDEQRVMAQQMIESFVPRSSAA